MSTLTELQHTGEFILAEPEPLISRAKVTVTVAAATRLQAGHVLAQLSATSKYVEYDNAGSDGSEEAAGILYDELDNTDGLTDTDFTATVVVRSCAVAKALLKWNSGVDSAGKTAAYADLAATQVIARD